MKKTTVLRSYLNRKGMLIVPGVHDALGAKIIEEAGFEAVYISGFCVAASYGYPDLGILSMREVVDRAASIADAVKIPVICDADDGYGNAINMIRTVRELEKAGVAGIHIEDQAHPKKCGAFKNKQLISREEGVGKVRAAVDTRTDPDFVIIARTDAVTPVSLEEAIIRGRLYEEAGADCIMVQIPRSKEEVKTCCASLKRVLLTVSESGIQPILPFSELEKMGLKIAVLTITLTLSAVTAMRLTAKELRETDFIKPISERNISFDDFLKLVGQPHTLELAEKYSR